MSLNYFKSSIRYVRRNTFNTVLNVGGLILGISASAFLFIYVMDEFRFDKFHRKQQAIFRVLKEQANDTRGVTTPGPLGERLLEKYPQVEQMARIGKWSGTFKTSDKVFEEGDVYFADNALFEIFDFTLLKGDPSAVLKNPNDIVLTEKTASKFFGQDWHLQPDVIGHEITMNGETHLTVVGVAANPPSYSSIQFDYLLSFEFIKSDRWNYQWGSHNFHTYLLLKENTDVTDFEEKIQNEIKDTPSNEGFELKLQPLKNIYMESFATYDWMSHGRPQYIVAFSLIGMLVLIASCLNYINLATSQAARRAKEIGIRKVNGAGRSNIFFQFMGESTVVVVFATVVARAAVDLLLPFFNELSGKNIDVDTFQTEMAILFLALAVMTSFLAGVYPALTLAKIKSLTTMKNKGGHGLSSFQQTALVTSQFTISLILISMTLMMYNQLYFMRNHDLGYNKHHLTFIKLGGSLKSQNENFKNDILKLSYIQNASRSTTTLVNTDNGSYIEWPGKKQGEEITITQMNVDTDFFTTLSLTLQTGRAFVATDSSAYILNEKAVKEMGLSPQQALGMKVKFWGTEGLIVGIVKDFHFRPMHHGISPLIMRHNLKENFYQLLVKVDQEKLDQLKKDVSIIYKRYEDTVPVSFGSFDESIGKEYLTEQRVSRVVTLFSTFAIIISLMGVLGMVSHTIQERSKEFSIRQVLGLQLKHLLFLLSEKFLLSYILAVAAATPIAYLLIEKWMENFEYTAGISPFSFLAGYLLVLGLAFSIIIVHSIMQIRTRPIHALKSE